MKRETNELNSRQWRLYEYLKAHCDEYRKLEDIASDMPEYQTEQKVFCNSTGRRLLTKDIQIINKSDEIQKFIMSDSYKGIKLASEKEYFDYLNRQKISTLSRLSRLYKLERKARLDGQIRGIKGEYARDEIQAFSDSINIYKSKRIAKHIGQDEAVNMIAEIIPDFNRTILSLIENGKVMPTEKQADAMEIIYG